MRNLERLADVLLDEQDRQAFGVQPLHQREHLVDPHRREPQRWLVEDQQPRFGHQRAADREHLLLSAGERAGALRGPLLQPRKYGEDALHVPRAVLAAAAIAAELEVLAHR